MNCVSHMVFVPVYEDALDCGSVATPLNNLGTRAYPSRVQEGRRAPTTAVIIGLLGEEILHDRWIDGFKLLG